MRKLLYSLIAIATLTSCEKDSAPNTALINTKWKLIPGDYKVYDTSGVFLYDMEIKFTTQPDFFNGGEIYFFRFSNFIGATNTAIYQNEDSPYTNSFRIGNCAGIYDAQGNHWNTTDLGSRAYNIFSNDTLEFNYIQENGPYWEADDTSYHYDTIRQIAVKQH